MQYEALDGWMLRLQQTGPMLQTWQRGPMLQVQYTHQRDAAKPASVSVFRMLRLQHREADADIAT